MKQLSQFINEAKATYCGRCGTTHVPPAKGGTCPALKEEDLPWHEDPKNPTRKVGVRKDQYGNVIKNVPKHLAKKAMQTNEEADLEENAKIVAHLQKRYGDNIRKSHVRSAANDFGVDASKLAKAVRTKLGKNMLDEEQIDEISAQTVGSYREKAYAQQPAGDDGSQLYKKRKAGRDMAFKKVTRGAKVMAKEEHEEDDGWYTHSQMHGSKKSEKHPKGISAAEWKSGIRWHHGKNKRINIKEEAEQIDELSKATLGSYTKKAARSTAGLAANAAARAALHGKASEYDKRTLRNRLTGISRATDRMTKEEVEAIDEVSAAKLRDYAAKASDARGHRNLPTAKLDKRYKSMALAHEKIRARHAQVAATEETIKTLSQFIEEANNNLFEADQIKAHHERVKKLKGKKVSFTHPVSKQKITGTMQKIVQMGGLPYAHVETGKSAHRVPVHQID